MITNYKIFEGFLKKQNLKKDIIKIFNSIDKNIMNHIHFFKKSEIYVDEDNSFDIYFDGFNIIKLFDCVYSHKTNNIFYSKVSPYLSMNEFDNKNLTYEEYLLTIKIIIKECYNLNVKAYANEDHTVQYLIDCFRNKCLFFNKDIFNKNFKEYIKYGGLKYFIEYYNIYKPILTQENINNIEHLVNANNFDLI